MMKPQMLSHIPNTLRSRDSAGTPCGWRTLDGVVELVNKLAVLAPHIALFGLVEAVALVF